MSDLNYAINSWLSENIGINVVDYFPDGNPNEKQLSFYVEKQKPSPPIGGKQHVDCLIKLEMRQQAGNDELNWLSRQLMASKDTAFFKYGSGMPEVVEVNSATEALITKTIHALVTVDLGKNTQKIEEVVLT